jgi:subtilisin family serine protease
MIGGEAMVTDCTSARSGRGFRLGTLASKVAILSAVLPALLIAAPAQAASLMNSVGPRLPTNIGPRGPMIDSVGPRFDPTLHSGGGGGSGGSSGGGASNSSSNNSSSSSSSRGSKNTKKLVIVRRAPSGPSGVPPGNERRYIPDHVVFELTGGDLNRVLSRYRLALLSTLPLPLLNTTIYNARILDGSTVPTKLRAMEAGGGVRVQPEYLFVTAADEAQAAEAADPTQYAVPKLHLDEAHAIARGDNVLVAVVDSGIDINHPALAGVVEKTFDALNSSEGPHMHGTALAGIIAGHNRVSGTAPAVHILGARAFSTTQGSTMSIIASIDWAVAQGARVINMSFAGPQDPALGRALAAAHDKKHNVVLVAASGNAGPKSPPLWPAADPNVIAVTATDFDDRLYPMANRGSHVAIAAPGVDIFIAIPGAGYKMDTGTSFSAGFVSGVAALILQRKPQLTPDEVKKVILSTAHDLGPKGRDDQFGAGLLDALQAVNAVAKPTEAGLQVPTH